MPDVWAAGVLWTGVALCWFAPVSLAVQAGVFLAAVAILGGPHGVFDLDLARWAAPRHRRAAFLTAFWAVYVGLAALVFVGWRWTPALTLAGFLVAATVHFGVEETRSGAGWVERTVLAAARGMTVVGAPVAVHPVVVAPIFAALAGTTTETMAALIYIAAPCFIVLWLAALATAAASLWRAKSWPDALELCGLVALFVLAPPLLAFTIYFCGVHAVRHVGDMASHFRRRRGAPLAAWVVRRILPAAVVTGAGLLALTRVGGEGAALLWSFRALASLTLPHLLLAPLLEQRAAATWPMGRAANG